MSKTFPNAYDDGEEEENGDVVVEDEQLVLKVSCARKATKKK